MQALRSILSALHTVQRDLCFRLQLVKEYASVVEDDFAWGGVLDDVVSAYKEHAKYPKPETINARFETDLTDAEASGDPEIALSRLVDELQAQAFKRRLIEAAAEDKLDEALQKARSLIIEYGGGPRDEVSGDISKLSFEAIYAEVCGRKPGLRIPIDELENVIYRIPYGRVFTVGAFTGGFKTSFAINLAEQNLIEGFNIAFLSLEMSKVEIYNRFLSRHSYSLPNVDEVPYETIEKGRLLDAQRGTLQLVEQNLRKMPGKLLIYDSSDVLSCGKNFIDSIEAVTRLADEECDGKLDAVIFDHIQLAKFYMKGKKDALEAGNEAMNKVRELSLSFKEGGLIWIVLSQFNRQSYGKALRKEGRYTLEAFAEVNELERASYYCLSLFFDEQLKAAGHIKYQLLKNRGGEVLEEPRTTACKPGVCAVGRVQQAELFSLDTMNEIYEAEKKEGGDIFDEMSDGGGVH